MTSSTLATETIEHYVNAPREEMSCDKLAAMLRDNNGDKVMILDVRDQDFVGGNIIGAVNLPSTSFTRQVIDETIKKIKENSKIEIVVFHCVISTSRVDRCAGPFSTVWAAETDMNNQDMPQIKALTNGFREFSKNHKDLCEKLDLEKWE